MFTVAYLNALQPKNSPYRQYEKASRSGFGVQVSPKGTKTFFYGYKIEGKQRFMKLGVFSTVSLKEAGELWQKWHNIKQSGYDPQTVRDNEIQEAEEAHRKTEEAKRKKAQQGSYGQLLTIYVDWLKANKRRSADNVQQVINANAYKIIPKSRKAKDVTPDDINETLAIMEKRGANILANRLRSYLSTAFKKGIEFNGIRTRKISTVQFGIERNPVNDVPKSEVKERVGERYLSESEIRTLWYDLLTTNMSKPVIGLLKLLLVTGQRVEEVLRMRLADIDCDSMLWELKETKSKRSHVVPLPDIAMQIIDELEADKESFLFISEKTGKLLRADSIPQACSRYCKQKDFERFAPRDLRRTWKTLAGKAGISKFDRDRYQNHALSDVSGRHYDKYDYLAEKRNAAIIWNDYLSNILLSDDKKVIPIRVKRG